MIILTSEYCFFNKREIGSLRKMQNFFGVRPNSYAGKVISRLFNNYFGYAMYSPDEFKKYYSQEFACHKEFLVCRLNISRQLSQYLIDNKLLYYKDRRYIRDDIAYNFDYEDKYKELFQCYVGGIEYEN